MLAFYLSLVSSNDEKSFVTELYRSINKRLIGYALKMSSDPDWSQDVVQHVFLYIIEHIQKFTEMPSDEILYYCLSIVRSQYGRWRKSGAEIVDLNSLENVLEDTSDGSMVEEFVLNQLDREEIKTVLMELSEQQQMLITMRYGMGLRHAEIAKHMGISESRSQNLLAQTMRVLRQKLEVRL